MPAKEEEFLITEAELKSINSYIGVSSGGQKGSLQVKLAEGVYAQEKTTKPVASFYKVKAKLQEQRAENSAVELWSEYISSIVSYDTTTDLKLNPKVKLAYKEGKAHLYSIYLGHQESYKGDAKVQTLDDWGKPKKGIGNDTSRHIHFSADGSSKKPNALDISGEANKLLRQDLCDHLAMAASMGDHDVNPGNMMVIKDKNGKDRLGHIDPGHAYNNQINAAEIFRGGFFNKDNHILDFFNRPNLTTQQPKLWRDYSGFSPSKELANSLKKVSAIDGSKKYDTAKTAMLAYIESVPQEARQNEKDEMRKSLVALSNRPGMDPDGMKKIEPGDDFDKVMTKTFDNLKAFDRQRKKEMGAVAKLMELQCDIEEFAKNAPPKHSKEYQEYKKSDAAQTLQKRFNEILDDKTKNPGIVSENKIQWIKNDAQSKPFKGDLNEFLDNRVQTIQKTKTLEKSPDNVQKESIFSKVKTFAKDYVKTLSENQAKKRSDSNTTESSFTLDDKGLLVKNPPPIATQSSDSPPQPPNKESFLSKAKTFAKNSAKALGGSIGTLSFGTVAFYLIAASIVGIATGGVALPIICAIAASACGYGAIKSAKIAKEGFTGQKSSPTPAQSQAPQESEQSQSQSQNPNGQNKESVFSKAKTFAKNSAKALGGSIGTLSFATVAFYLIATSIVGIATGGVALPIIGAIAASACGYGAIKSAKIAKEGFTGQKSSPTQAPPPSSPAQSQTPEPEFVVSPTERAETARVTPAHMQSPPSPSKAESTVPQPEIPKQAHDIRQRLDPRIVEHPPPAQPSVSSSKRESTKYTAEKVKRTLISTSPRKDSKPPSVGDTRLKKTTSRG